MRKFIKKLDIFGRRVQLRIGDNKSHRTICGAILTIMLFVCLTALSIYMTLEWITKSDP
jgi:hypothetical protein